MRWSDISFTRTTLRQFSAIWIVFFGGLGLWYGLRHDHHTLGMVLGVLAVTIGPLGLWRPEWIKPIYTGWMAAVFPIGWLMSNIILAVMYFVVVTPVAIFFRLIGRDTLQRRPQAVESYWQPKATPANMGQYLRQY